MTTNTLISIIIPVLNGAQFLDRCYSTLTNQEYPNLEVIFVDNGSIDNSLDVINNYCSMHNNYRLITCKEKGPGSARNRGIEDAKGDFISFLDVDDELAPDKFILLLDAFSKYPNAGMVVGNTIKEYADGRKYKLDLGPMKVGINKAPFPGLLWLQHLMVNPTTCSYLVKSDVFKEEHIEFSKIPYGEDIALNVCIGLKYDVAFIENTVCIYHRHMQSNISISNTKISPLERYYRFYEGFALKKFYPNKNIYPSSIAYKISEGNAYRFLQKLIKVERKKYYINTLNDLKKKSLLSNSISRNLLYYILPYYIADFISEKLNKVSY